MYNRRLVRSGLSFLSLSFLLIVLLSGTTISNAQVRTEYRAFWVDTFNTTLNNHNDVVAVVNNARAAKANAIFAQVRRRGDAWYLNSLEPKPDFTPIAAGFDPLQDLITEAHAHGIEVHAFVIVGAVWNKNPNFAPSATLGRPTNPNHVFNLHGGYNSATQQIVPGPNNWLTRTLLPDNSANLIGFQGHRFGNDFWIDLGRPDAAAYTADVLTHLVRNYPIDGLHLDRIRYPEFIVLAGQTPQTANNGTNIGYNYVSIERFQRRHNIPLGSPPPLPSDNLWKQWRRDQVSNLVRRVYLNAIALRPQIKVSAALITFGAGPTTEASWNNAEAYWRVYQDWRGWTEEGILDIAIPMVYKREHSAAEVTQYNQWNEWLKNHQYNRAGIVGQGGLSNAIEGTLRQTRRALAPSAAGNSGVGIIFYSMATSNVAVAANPFSIPGGQNTPARPFSEFASGLVSGKSANGLTLYETNPIPIFAETAAVPTFEWKASPTLGHLMGFAKRTDNTPLDTAVVTITNLNDGSVRTGATDGGGFYGGVDMRQGQYLVKAVLGTDILYSCVANVNAGAVTSADLGAETAPPVTTALTNPAMPNGTNGWYTSNVSVALTANDTCSGVALTEYSMDGAAFQPYTGSFTVTGDGTHTIQFRSTDRAGNQETAVIQAIKIDSASPAATFAAAPTTIFPPNGKQVTVTLTGTATDATSGLAQVSYVVTDEYGTPLSIAPRTLIGNSAGWSDTLNVTASRLEEDRDGRLYRIVATIMDSAGNTTTRSADVVVLHDRRNQ